MLSQLRVAVNCLMFPDCNSDFENNRQNKETDWLEFCVITYFLHQIRTPSPYDVCSTILTLRQKIECVHYNLCEVCRTIDSARLVIVINLKCKIISLQGQHKIQESNLLSQVFIHSYLQQNKLSATEEKNVQIEHLQIS